MKFLRSMGKTPVNDPRLLASPNYRDGQFQNLSPTPQLAPGVGYGKILRQFLKPHPGKIPKAPLSVGAPKWERYDGDAPAITWLGHSSYLVQVKGYNILVDPVLSQRASFLSWLGPKAFAATHVFSPASLPPIHLVLLTHDHYDHLDFAVVRSLAATVRHFVAPLGVGSHLRYWGVPAAHITELDWGESTELAHLHLTAMPARHFSGRGLRRNQTLWTAYALRSGPFALYLGGDSGYDGHFAEAGKRDGPFDLAILECGQYNDFWPFIHMRPEETAQAAVDLQAKALLPVHWGRFSLAMHAWTEPAERVVAAAEKLGLALALPRPGESFVVGEAYPHKAWWREVG